MKTKGLVKLLVGLTLAASGAFAVGSGLSNKKAEVVEAAVTNGAKRFNILIHPSSWWKDDNAIIKATYSDAGQVTITKDSDLGAYSNTYSNFNKVNIGGTNYYALSMNINANDFTYGNFYFGRYNPSNDADWGNSGWVLSPTSVKNGTSNTVWINSSSTFEQNNNLFKVAYHENGNTTYQLVEAASFTPAAPSAPKGYTFDAWYKESNFQTKFTSATLTGDINLYAKFVKDEYYLVGDSNFVSDIGSAGSTWDKSGGYLMDTITSDSTNNKAETWFSFTKTVQLKAISYKNGNTSWLDVGNSSGTGISVVNGNYQLTAGTYSFYVGNDSKLYIANNLQKDAYCSAFLSRTGSVCNGASTVEADLLVVWNSLGTDFTKMSASDQASLANTVASESGTDDAKVMARYDVIIKNHKSFTDFMDRKNQSNYHASANVFPISRDNSNTIAIIVVISLVSVTAIGGYFFIKKRRTN